MCVLFKSRILILRNYNKMIGRPMDKYIQDNIVWNEKKINAVYLKLGY